MFEKLHDCQNNGGIEHFQHEVVSHHERQSFYDFGLPQKPQTPLWYYVSCAQEDLSISFSKELQQKYNMRSIPICKDNEVQVGWGDYKCQQTVKVGQVCKYVVCIEGV